MLIDRNRQKLIHAIKYFAGNVQYPGKTKIFKLLYFLDFLHYEKTGRSVTGLTYFAWPMGPVPVELHEELDHPLEDLKANLQRRHQKLPGGFERVAFEPLGDFDENLFSPFELRLIQQLAKEHFRDNAQQISDKTHFGTGPWEQVYEIEGKKQAEIPYEYCLLRRANQKDMEVLELAKERDALVKHYSK